MSRSQAQLKTRPASRDSGSNFIFVDGERPLSTLDCVMIGVVGCIVIAWEFGVTGVNFLKLRRRRDVPPAHIHPPLSRDPR